MYIDLASPIRVDMFCRFAPTELPNAVFSKQRIFLIHLLKGEMEALIGKETRHFSAGDTILLEPGQSLRPTAVYDVRYYLLQLSAKTVDSQASTITLDSETLEREASDPQMHFNMNPFLSHTSHYDLIRVRMRLKSNYNYISRFFFRTSDYNYNMSQAVERKISECPKDEDGYYLVDFDMHSHPLWNGVITGLRFDPVECETVAEIDFIRFYKRVKSAQEQGEQDEKLVYSVEFSDESDEHQFRYFNVLNHTVHDAVQDVPLPGAEFANLFFSAASRTLQILTPVPRSDKSKDVLKLLLQMEMQQSPDRKDMLDALARELLILLGDTEKTSDDYPLTLRNIQQYIRNHYAEQLTLHILAEHFNISDSYITRLFRVHLHTASQDYINQYRLSMACSLLVNSKLKINEIARLVGIPNPYYFSRLFRKKMLMTPLAYRNSRNT